MQWVAVDLHLHTPASSDFQQPEVTLLDLLKKAESRGLSMIAFTDHNSVAGYRRLQDEIQQLSLLEKLNRILPEERSRLEEYRRLLGQILVLPGFEFTATFGFHILGIFSPDKPIREIEHLLLDLNIPAEQLDEGSATIGAATDVLTAYRLIDEAGGLVIAAHANSNNGVAMRGFPIGGQTKIAYTQDTHLHALEVTDLEARGNRTTAAFFSGTKPEYPRRMHCIQGSDAHRLTTDPQRKKNLGLGDRSTDVLLPEVSFEALREVFLSNDFARTRPHRATLEPAFDFIRRAQEEGPNIIQSFHESIAVKGGKFYAILMDICALANTNGGTLYIGLTADPKKPLLGVPEPEQAVTLLDKELGKRLSPPLPFTIDIHESRGKKILRVLVPRGDDPPYVLDDYKIYVRSETETDLAVRDEIVSLVLRGGQERRMEEPAEAVAPIPVEGPAVERISPTEGKIQAPRTGVEVVAVEEREEDRFFTMRDLRNGNVVKNVTFSSARKLWHEAIASYSRLPEKVEEAKIQWQGMIGFLRRYKQGKINRYDLLQRTPQGIRYYFGVTEDGIDGPWKKLVGLEDEPLPEQHAG